MEEKITLINGNGKPYILGLPRIVWLTSGAINDVALQHIWDNTGLWFRKGAGNTYGVQPRESKQIVALFMTYNFKTNFYNNNSSPNTLYIKSDHHVGFNVESICYDCCVENGIPHSGLEPGDRLAC